MEDSIEIYRSKKDLGQMIADIDPGLKKTCYQPNKNSHHFKWTTKVFRDETGALVFNSLPYLMPQIESGIVLGYFQHSAHEIGMDITRPEAEYKHTLKHEQGHVYDGDEYLADSHAEGNYRLAA
jgi:hypothetical protein